MESKARFFSVAQFRLRDLKEKKLPRDIEFTLTNKGTLFVYLSRFFTYF